MTNTQISSRVSVRVAQVLNILNNVARNDITIPEACEEEGISPSTFNRWYAERQDEIVSILEIIAIARVQQVTQLAQIKQQGIEILMERIKSPMCETKDILAILKYVGTELDAALNNSGAYDESQEKKAQEYAKSLQGPKLRETDSRYTVGRSESDPETKEISEADVIEGNYTDL